MSNTLTITSKGQVTLGKELLQHLGVQPGEKIAVDKLPDGRIAIQAARSTAKTTVIAYEGAWLGAEIFISFDKKAVRLMESRGESVRLLS
jgi:AbrB family looped-hinge helix DNA binding protein